MTNEQAITVLNMVEAHGMADEAKKMAIQALSQEPSGDLISREELLKAIDTWDKFGVDDTNSLFRLDNLSLPHYVPYIHYDDVVKCIKGMPSVAIPNKVGHWKRISMDKYTTHAQYWYECDKCGEHHLGDTNFCPNCGAKMD